MLKLLKLGRRINKEKTTKPDYSSIKIMVKFQSISTNIMPNVKK